VDAWDVPTAWNRHHVDVVIAVPVFGIHDIAEIQEPPMERDALRDRTLRRHSKMTDEPVLDRGMCEVEVVVAYDEVEMAAGQDEPSERLKDPPVSIRD
jgi:hypothetical protein